MPHSTMRRDTIVRQARTSDVDDIVALIDLYVADGTLLARSREFIRERLGDFLVAVDGETILGCVHLEEYSPSIAEIRSLAVSPSAQGRGVGVSLVDHAEQLAVRREYRTLFAVSNSEAFFGARGFLPRHIPELDRERSEVSRYKAVSAKDIAERAGS
ncbi:MAG: GNAT family N-acetyltransferase [Gemmatimonadaceae bacterium]